MHAYTVFFIYTASPHGLYNSSSSAAFASSLILICDSFAAGVVDCRNFADLCPASLPTIGCALFWAMFPRRSPCNVFESLARFCSAEFKSDGLRPTQVYKQHTQPIHCKWQHISFPGISSHTRTQIWPSVQKCSLFLTQPHYYNLIKSGFEDTVSKQIHL